LSRYLWCTSRLYTWTPFVLIYINDLPKASHFNSLLFADDTVLTLSDPSYTTLTAKVNHELSKIDSWMKLNKLTINYKKTKYMLFTNKKVSKITKFL